MASTSVFINLVTTDLERSKAFYRALGCDINPDFTDENAACVVWDENIFFMVLMWDFFVAYTDKPIADPRTSAQVSVSFALDSREAVDAIVERGIAAGAPRRRAAGVRIDVLARSGRPRRQLPRLPPPRRRRRLTVPLSQLSTCSRDA